MISDENLFLIYLADIKDLLFISTSEKLLKLKGFFSFGSKQIKMALRSFQVCCSRLYFLLIITERCHEIHPIQKRSFTFYWFTKSVANTGSSK